MSEALRFKEEGNRLFQSGNYNAADGLYSKAIIADPKNPALYTNRAMARLKLGFWDSVVSDCMTCVDLAPTNMKAHYYLAQAQLALDDPASALTGAMRAHELCVATNDRSLAPVTALVLRCKKMRWEKLEKARLRDARDLQRSVLDLLDRDRDEALELAGDDEMERTAISVESERKAAQMLEIFEAARAQSEKKREVPEYVIDDISFDIMIDPVITKTGKSYERASIMEHLRRHASDPLTREPLVPSDLRSNLALRKICEEFLEQNGWAADW